MKSKLHRAKRNIEKVKKYAEDHKEEIKKGGTVVLLTAASLYAIKNWDKVKDILNDIVDQDEEDNDVVIENAEEDEMVDCEDGMEDTQLSGNRMTARELGNKMFCSAQDINKRLIKSGLAKREPWGNVTFTDEGKTFGEKKDKTTVYGHGFTNIEWDESVLSRIFSKEEIEENDRRRKEVEKVRKELEDLE